MGGKRDRAAGQETGKRGGIPSDPDGDIELHLNEIAADQAVCRITLQCMLLALFATRREAASQSLVELKTQVMRSIRGMPDDPSDRRGAARWKRLTATRARDLFLELEDALDRSVSPAESTPAKPRA